MKVLYHLEPIGITGKCEATDVIRFCCNECRDKWLTRLDQVKLMFGDVSVVLEEGDTVPSYPDESKYPGVLKKGTERYGLDGEECNECGTELPSR
jgi:hypothetical protein